jgi:aminoglycoside 6'-N-acetyltransferase
MIARVWTGAVRKQDRAGYAAYLRKTGVAAYAQTPGNKGVWMLRRDVNDRTEFVLVTLWDSLQAVKAFAGDDYEAAVYYPEDDRFLVEKDLRASHFKAEVYETPADDRPVLLRGDHIVLRPLRADDVEPVSEIQSQPEVARWWGPPSEELRRQAEGRSEEKALAIELNGELVGLIQYHEENEPDFRHASIDLFLAEHLHGRGLGTDAVRTMARYLIEERGHHRLTIDPAADNVAAVRAYEKVGFRPVGRMREYWRSPDGTWHDGLLMDLVAGDLGALSPAQQGRTGREM